MWVTKYRKEVLTKEIKARCRQLIIQGCKSNKVKIISGVVSIDHVHLVIQYPPHIALSVLIQELKGRSSRRLQEEFKELGKKYWGRHFWATGYGAWSLGTQSEELVKQYIKHHTQDPDDLYTDFILEM